MTIKVKPLVWEQEPRNGWKVGVVYARGYHLIRREDGWHIGNGFGFTGDVIFPDLEAAKAFAQADYEARILSAIEPVDPATIRAEALREACKAAIEAYDKANPFRTADYHGDGCDCFRCCMDVMRALIDKE